MAILLGSLVIFSPVIVISIFMFMDHYNYNSMFKPPNLYANILYPLFLIFCLGGLFLVFFDFETSVIIFVALPVITFLIFIFLKWYFHIDYAKRERNYYGIIGLPKRITKKNVLDSIRILIEIINEKEDSQDYHPVNWCERKIELYCKDMITKNNVFEVSKLIIELMFNKKMSYSLRVYFCNDILKHYYFKYSSKDTCFKELIEGIIDYEIEPAKAGYTKTETIDNRITVHDLWGYSHTEGDCYEVTSYVEPRQAIKFSLD